MNDQQRAALALEAVRGVQRGATGELPQRLYRSYVERLGATILMNGLGQALAIEAAAAGLTPQDDDEKAHRALYENISCLLVGGEGSVYPDASDALEAIVAGSQDKYLAAHAEVLSWLSWHKKFCQAYLPRAEKAP